jgi:hypothetical protein
VVYKINVATMLSVLSWAWKNSTYPQKQRWSVIEAFNLISIFLEKGLFFENMKLCVQAQLFY